MGIKKDKFGAKTYETGKAVCNSTKKSIEYSIVDNGTPDLMLHISSRAYVSNSLSGIKAILEELSRDHDFTIQKDVETKLQIS